LLREKLVKTKLPMLILVLLASIGGGLGVFLLGRRSVEARTKLDHYAAISRASIEAAAGDRKKYFFIQQALDELPPGGGTVFVNPGMRIDATGITIKTPVHLVFDCGVFTYDGDGAAITVLAAASSGVQIEGCAAADETNPTHGTAIVVRHPAAGGLNVLASNDFIARNLSFVGAGSGSGTGVHLSGNGAQLYNVQADKFGGDGFVIDGDRSNTNNCLLERVRSRKNGGRGFVTFGKDSNVGVWIQTYAQANGAAQYAFDHTVGHVFVALSAEPERDEDSLSFVAASENRGTVYVEPAAPFRAASVSFDRSSKNNDLVLLNGRQVSDEGTGNRYEVAAIDYTPEVRRTDNGDTNKEGSFSPIRKLATGASAEDSATEGMWWRPANLRSGYTLHGNGSINFDFDMARKGASVNFFHSANDAEIASSSPVLRVDENGLAIGAGSTLRSLWHSGATLKFTVLPARSCQERAIETEAVLTSRDVNVTVSPLSDLGSTQLSWQAYLKDSDEKVVVRLCNVSDAGLLPRTVQWSATVFVWQP
jgi:hypothetical protein